MRELVAHIGAVSETAIVEDGHLVEFVRDDHLVMEDAIILGIVERIVPALQAAFVDIGAEKNGFLPLEERKASATGTWPTLQTGDRVLVQVKREPSGDKGAFLSRDISLASSHVIVMPMSLVVGVSSRITYAPRREELHALGEKITAGAFGIVMRTSAETAEDRVIRNEVRKLMTAWDEIIKVAATEHAPSVIYQKSGSAEMLLTDYLPRGIDTVTTDSEAFYDRVRRKMETYLVEENPIETRGLDKERDRGMDRIVWLKSGANLVIDECEALTVIDVNTSKSTGTEMDRQILMRTNMEACHEIARQIRLRNLGGIILIDMIDMASDDDRERILECLEMDLRDDRVKTVIHGFTSLGLIEMTRRRTRPSLRRTFAHPCPTCRGAGFLPNREEFRGGDNSGNEPT